MNESDKLSLFAKLSALFIVLGISRFCAYSAKAKDPPQPTREKKSILYRRAKR